MGCVGSKKFVVDEDNFGFGQTCYEIYTSLGLTNKQLDLLYTAFYDMDADNSGSIRLDEFLIYFGLETDTFTERLFGMFDLERSKCLNFMCYVATLWYFLSLESKKVGGFAYRLYDSMNNGVLTIPVIEDMMKAINAHDPANATKIEVAITKLPGYGERKPLVPLNAFLEWAEIHQTIFASMLTSQYKLRSQLFGSKFWKNLELKRSEDAIMSDVKFDISLKDKMSAALAEHVARVRRSEVEKAKLLSNGKVATRTRITMVMVNKLNPGKGKKREGKGEGSENYVAPVKAANAYKDVTLEDEISAIPKMNSQQAAVKKEVPKAQRHRRSIFKPNLVIEEKAPQSSKIEPVGGVPPGSPSNQKKSKKSNKGK